MAENSEINTISGKKTDLKSLPSQDLEKIPLLPRSAWNSQLGYLKVLLKAKQVLDKS
ncbi:MULTISPECIES: hypothetical protein [unclassified Nostoc]|uniref:hypothetical protein n=1 Tax=unclassified Nostoc TaxID=2593658 RepID=UPI0025AA88E7|nr:MULTISPECIES: hypothetical protein [unclassified Nostoc]MDM9586135.1 hypothetical protein [Nostoc sp. GT001]MDZ7945583.1 hypothetical protein [Nostoc sp. EfeVER01]MDZ7990941.1 hypothetical protein [Nostoc sp. EspVER01]